MKSRAVRALRSPIVWMVGVLAGLLAAPAAASAQEIVVLTAANNTASGMLVGDPGGRFHEFWFDNYPGAWIRVRNTPDLSRSYELTNFRRPSAPIRAEVWSSNGLEDTSSFSRRTAARCTPGRTFRTERDCWSFGAGSADVLNPNAERLLIKVANYAQTGISYTLDVRGLDTNATLAGAPAGTMAPMAPVRRTALTGMLAGRTGGNSVYYSFAHPGGGDRALGGTDTDVLVRVSPNLNGPLANNVQVKVYRGMQVAGMAVGGRPRTGPNPQTNSNARDFEIEVRSPDPGIYAVEIWNGNEGVPIWYSVSID